MEYIVYVKTNSSDYITAVSSSAFLADAAGWTELDRGYGNQYCHAQSNYFPEPIWTDGGAYRYKLVDGKAVECSTEEIREQEAKILLPVAPRNIIAWEYVTINGVMYRATDNIPNGAYIITGQNAVVTTVEEQLYEMTKGE